MHCPLMKPSNTNSNMFLSFATIFSTGSIFLALSFSSILSEALSQSSYLIPHVACKSGPSSHLPVADLVRDTGTYNPTVSGPHLLTPRSPCLFVPKKPPSIPRHRPLPFISPSFPSRSSTVPTYNTSAIGLETAAISLPFRPRFPAWARCRHHLLPCEKALQEMDKVGNHES